MRVRYTVLDYIFHLTYYIYYIQIHTAKFTIYIEFVICPPRVIDIFYTQ